jgi:hypothetical protein
VPEIEIVEASASSASGVVVPNLSGRGLRAAIRIGTESGLVVQADGSGVVRKQSLLPGAVVAPGTVLTVELKR